MAGFDRWRAKPGRSRSRGARPTASYGPGRAIRATGMDIDAAVAEGWQRNPDYNNGKQEGFGYYQVTQKDKQRWSTASAYLRPAVERNKNNVKVMDFGIARAAEFEWKRLGFLLDDWLRPSRHGCDRHRRRYRFFNDHWLWLNDRGRSRRRRWGGRAGRCDRRGGIQPIRFIAFDLGGDYVPRVLDACERVLLAPAVVDHDSSQL